MAQLLVRHLDDDVKAAKLQRRAHRHGPSTEEEARGKKVATGRRFARRSPPASPPELRDQPAQPAG